MFGPAAAVDVIEVGKRMTRFGPELDLDTIFWMAGTEFVRGLDVIHSTRVVAQYLTQTAGYEFAFHSREGRWLGRFRQRNPLVRAR